MRYDKKQQKRKQQKKAGRKIGVFKEKVVRGVILMLRCAVPRTAEPKLPMS